MVSCTACPAIWGGERLVQPRDGGQVRFTREDQDRAERSGATDTSSKLTAISSGEQFSKF